MHGMWKPASSSVQPRQRPGQGRGGETHVSVARACVREDGDLGSAGCNETLSPLGFLQVSRSLCDFERKRGGTVRSAGAGYRMAAQGLEPALPGHLVGLTAVCLSDGLCVCVLDE